MLRGKIMEHINIAFIGCGGMAGVHCASLGKLWKAGCRGFKAVAVCDIIESKAVDMSNKFKESTGHTPAVYTDALTMFNNEKDLTTVLIATPHSDHHISACMAIEAGVNVLIEKPLGITIRAAKKIIECAKKHNILLHVAENYRMDVNERALHWAIKQGMIGTPRILNWVDTGERKWYWDWRDHIDLSGGAWTFDGGVHHSDLFQYNFGSIKRVTAVMKSYDNTRYAYYQSMSDYEQAKKDKRSAHFRKTRSLKPIDPATLSEPVEATVEDTTAAILEFDSGVIGTWLVSRAAPGKEDRTNIIYGSEGAIVWGDGVYNNRQEQVYTKESLAAAFLESLTSDEKEILFPYGIMDSLSIEWKQHLDALGGIRPVEVTAEVGLNAMAVPIAIYESAFSGEPVYIEDILNLKVENYQKQINKIQQL